MALKSATILFVGVFLSTKRCFQVLYQYLHVLLNRYIIFFIFLVCHSSRFMRRRVAIRTLVIIERCGMETAHLLFDIVMKEYSLVCEVD